MPFINSKMNVKLTQEQREKVKSRLGRVIDIIPGKSENWLMVGFEEDYSLYFKGNDTPGIAFIEVKSYGRVDKKCYERMTEAICEIWDEELGIRADRIYVTYEEISNWGWNGTNF